MWRGEKYLRERYKSVDLETGLTAGETRQRSEIKQLKRRVRSLRRWAIIQLFLGIIIGAVISYIISTIWFN